MGFILSYFKKYSNFIIPLSIFTSTFLIYLHNLSRFVYGGDVGDLLLAVGVRGVAHPSGYPLFTLLGIVFSYLPISQPLAYKVALVSVISSSLSVVLLYLVCLNLTKNKLISIISSLIFAFSYVVWLYAEVAEVFALAALFVLVLLCLVLLFYEKKKNVYLYLISFFAGLSLSHHLIIITIFPFIGVLIIRSNWRVVTDYKILLKCFFLFLVGFLPYLYIPIAASQFPVYSWGNVINLKNFLHLILRSDYSWSPEAHTLLNKGFLNLRIMATVNYFFDLYRTITIFTLGFSLIGIANLILKRKFSILFSLLFIYTLVGPFFIFYGATPNKFAYTGGIVERFYIFSLIFIVIFFSLGFSLVLDLIEKILQKKHILKNRINFYKQVLYLVILIIPVYLMVINFKTTDLSNASTGEQFGKDYLRSLPYGSFVFISGDTATLNTWYVQYVRGFRKDVTVINPQQPSLNIKFVKKIYPNFTNLKEDYLELKSRINKFVLKNYNVQPIYSGYGATSIEEKGINWIPYGLSQKMMIGENIQTEAEFIKQTNEIWKEIKFKKFSELTEAEKNSQTLLTVQSMYSYSAVKTGVYLMKEYSSFEEARKYFELADQINPNDNLGKWGLANYYFNKKDCKESEEKILDILNEDKQAKEPYIYLYLIYDECFYDKNKVKRAEKKYREIFKEEIPKSKNKTFL